MSRKEWGSMNRLPIIADVERIQMGICLKDHRILSGKVYAFSGSMDRLGIVYKVVYWKDGR